MPTNARQFLQKISEFPPEVEFYYQSKMISKTLNELYEKYNVKKGYLGDLVEDLTMNNFNFSGIEIRLKNELGIDEVTAKSLAMDIMGMIFLPIGQFLKNVNIKNELLKRGSDISKYRRFINDFLEEIEDMNFELMDDLMAKYGELVDPHEEEVVAVELFENNLVDILKQEDSNAVASLNSGMVYLLYNREGFKDKIANILLSSEKILTSQQIELDGKSHNGSVRNWLRDFIKNYGSGMFDNVVLSKYLIGSNNAKKLDESERNLLKKLLLLYRAIKFFSKSLEEIPPEDWEIFPVESEKQMSKARIVAGPPKTESEKRVDGLKKTEAGYGQETLERKAVDEEITREKELEQLRYMANKYREGSLERRAIEEEINKINSQL